MSDKLRVTITYEYDAVDRWYDSNDSTYKVEIDQRNWERYGLSLIGKYWGQVSVKVEHVG